MRWLPVLALLPAACDGTSGQAADGAEPVTYWRDVKPFVQRTCERCHRPGGIGPYDFGDPAQAGEHSTDMLTRVLAGEMPPPTSDPDCREYTGSQHFHLSEDEVATLEAWVEAGAPEGDPADAPAPEDLESHLDDTDLELRLPVEHSIDASDDDNEYFCYLVSHGRSEPFAITAFDVDVTNPGVVHHMVLFKTPSGDAAAEYGGADADGGFPCGDPILGDDWQFLHAWAPGMPPTELPSGHGMTVSPSEQLVLQMHYYQTSEGTELDRSAYRLRTAETVSTEVTMQPIGPPFLRIPAGDPDVVNSFDYAIDGASPNILGMFPHMHMLGTSYAAAIQRRDGDSECLVRGDYDFSFQLTYMYPNLVPFEPGDRLQMECHWDNSAENPNQHHDPPEDVAWGEGSHEEMCYFLTYMALP